MNKSDTLEHEMAAETGRTCRCSKCHAAAYAALEAVVSKPTAAPVFVALTRSVTRRIARVRTAWQPDYVREGPGGLGFAFGSFDQTRMGVATVTYADGTIERSQVHSEMEPEEYRWMRVGERVTRTTDLLRPAIQADDIPW